MKKWLVIAAIADATTFLAMAALRGTSLELNGFALYALAHFGLAGFVAFKALDTGLVLGVSTWLSRNPKLGDLPMLVGVGIVTLGAVTNVMGIAGVSITL